MDARAVSADVAAAQSDRPDHGPMGAYDAWPAVTVDAMCNLGHWQEGVSFLRRTQAAIYEGVYAQARELFGPDKLNNNASVRIAQRRGCMRECCGGGAFAETTVTTLFGFRPRLGGISSCSMRRSRGDFVESLDISAMVKACTPYNPAAQDWCEKGKREDLKCSSDA